MKQKAAIVYQRLKSFRKTKNDSKGKEKTAKDCKRQSLAEPEKNQQHIKSLKKTKIVLLCYSTVECSHLFINKNEIVVVASSMHD